MSDMEPSDGEHDSEAPFGNSDESGGDSDGGGLVAVAARKKGAATRAFREPDDEDEDDEDDDDDEDAPPPEEDDDDDDDDDEEERAVPEKKQQKMSQFYGMVPPSSGGSKGGTSASAKRGKAGAPAAGRPNGSKENGKGGASKSKSKLLELKASDEEDSDGEPMTRDLVRKPLKLNTTAADPFEEHDQLRRQYANGGGSKAGTETDAGKEEVLPKVNIFQMDNPFLLKNDKGPQAKRFWSVNAQEACMHAPNYKGTAECALTMTVETLMQPRKEREAMLNAAAGDPAKLDVMAQQAMVFHINMDPAGSGGGPGITNVAGFLPYRLEDKEDVMEGFYEQYLDDLNTAGAAEFPHDAHATFLIPVEEKLMKKIIKAGKGTFPRMYDPNRLSSTKYRLVTKLEEQAKIDTNFTLLPQPAHLAKGKRKRGAGAQSAAAAKKAKPPTDGASTSGANGRASAEDEDEEQDCVHVHVEPCFTRIKWTAIPSMGVSMAGIKVAPGTDVRLVPAGEGSYILVKTPAGP